MAEPTSDNTEMFPTIGDMVHNNEDAVELPTIIESLCMNCHDNGETRLLLTKIPYFKEIIISSFSCPHCGFKNSEVQPAGEVQEQACKYTLTVNNAEDFNRYFILSDSATFTLSELQFERPPGKGEMTNLEGILTTALDSLRESNILRREQHPDQAEQVDAFIADLAMYVAGVKFPFTVVVDDPSGNSFVENPVAPKQDKHLKLSHYVRSKEQNEQLGLFVENVINKDNFNSGADYKEPKGGNIAERGDNIDSTIVDKEVIRIPAECSNCHTAGDSLMYMTDIPFFKEVIIMAFNCDACGFRSNEIKGGGSIPKKGQKSTLSVAPKSDDEEVWGEDMSRDVIKSNSSGIEIPELELVITHGSLGGMYTTVEGLLEVAEREFMSGFASDYIEGDSIDQARKDAFVTFKERFTKVRNGEMGFSLIIEDPMANSYIYSPYAPDPDPRLTIQKYERTDEENEELGLNHMNVDHYDDDEEEDPNAEPKYMTKEARDQIGETMRRLQIGGSKTHPDEEVVKQPEVSNPTESLEAHR